MDRRHRAVTRLEVQVREPVVVHTLSVQQIQRWLDGVMSHNWAEPSKRPRGPLRRTIVTIEEPPEALTTPNATTSRRPQHVVDEFVPEALVVALTMIVLDELGERPPQVVFAERDDPAKTLVLDRSHEAFGVGIGVGRLERGLHDSNPGFFKSLAD